MRFRNLCASVCKCVHVCARARQSYANRVLFSITFTFRRTLRFDVACISWKFHSIKWPGLNIMLTLCLHYQVDAYMSVRTPPCFLVTHPCLFKGRAESGHPVVDTYLVSPFTTWNSPCSFSAAFLQTEASFFILQALFVIHKPLGKSQKIIFPQHHLLAGSGRTCTALNVPFTQYMWRKSFLL